MVGACSTNGVKRNVRRVLMGKPERKRLLGRPRHRWVYVIIDGVWIGYWIY
jgi:hypothetical protein